MNFAECLQTYLRETGATASQLADTASLSRSSVSRYLSGQRAPDPNGDVPEKLAQALVSLAVEREDGQGAPAAPAPADRPIDDAAEREDGAQTTAPATGPLDADEVRAALSRAAADHVESGADFAAFPSRLGNVLDTFGVAHNRLARSMGFDPSYISRILAGKRHPADPARFVDEVASYIARNYGDAMGISLTADLTGLSEESLAEPFARVQAIRHYLGSNADEGRLSPNAMESFLEKLDEFNLDDFLKGIRFDEMKVPTAPFQLPTTKTYTGIEQMKQAELDFLRAAVLSKSTDDVILYSDMPLGEMAQDQEFAKKVMAGMAMLIRKGVHLRNIHDVHRPLDELFMGLEGWIPVYMTGQITPYYLSQPTNTAFLHFIRSAGTVAVSGEAIVGNQGSGRYVVTKSPADVAYQRRRAEELLGRAKPLMSVYREEDAAQLTRALRKLERRASAEPVEIGVDTFRNMKVTVWPGSHALIEKARSPKVSLLVEYPTLVDALEHYEPTLF